MTLKVNVGIFHEITVLPLLVVVASHVRSVFEVKFVKSCHAPSIHPGRGRHSETIVGPK